MVWANMFSDEMITICGRSFVHNLVLQWSTYAGSLQWRHNGLTGVSNHQPHDCLLNRLFRRRPKKTPTLRVTGLCAGNSPVTGEFPAQMASNAENFSIWWRHHVVINPGKHWYLELGISKLLAVYYYVFQDVFRLLCCNSHGHHKRVPMSWRLLEPPENETLGCMIH